jgi:hypothetical protein
LAATLRAWAKGLLCLEAAVELLIGHRSWLLREDFGQVAIEAGRHVFTGQALASVDLVAAVESLEAGALPCSSGERQVLLVAASIAEGVPVDLREALSALDARTITLVARAVFDAAGHREAGVTAAEMGW